ncbi:hypothetical protein FJU08_16090 [Martelella alba]|uniref:NolW-like domain-containing protein n=1 Tax=Martelella alba TaxID=2590451 RepID=A0A506U5U7_9HYPH|nr:secretin N-terminal domain-containing protein [Martelella alba]TPW28848.1 hypothetical protein FJU08_16090 [Martelella alba]
MLQRPFGMKAHLRKILVLLVFGLAGGAVFMPVSVAAASARLMSDGRLYMPPALPDAGADYSFAGEDQTLTTALKYFALNIGVSLVMDPSVPTVQNGGEPPGLSRAEYIDYLADKFRLVWYFDGATLFVDTVDHVEQKVFSLQKADGMQVLTILQNLDLFQPKFLFSYDLQSKVLMTSGPPSYVNLVESTVKAVDTADGRSTNVYRGATARLTGSGAGAVALGSGLGTSSPALAGDVPAAMPAAAPLTLGGQ